MKNIIIVVLSVLVIALCAECHLMDKRAAAWVEYAYKADAYIEALEKDYPDYIDTTSGTDEYSEYYELKGEY